jgi:hypothetical protein
MIFFHVYRKISSHGQLRPIMKRPLCSIPSGVACEYLGCGPWALRFQDCVRLGVPFSFEMPTKAGFAERTADTGIDNGGGLRRQGRGFITIASEDASKT